MNRLRLFEYAAEKAITVIAFLSVAFIFLILFFVVREASSIVTAPAENAGAGAGEAMETYGGDMETYGEEETPETPAGETAPAETNPATREAPSLWRNLLGAIWLPISNVPKYGLWPLIVGSIKVTAVALLVAVPLGLLCALYTFAFSPAWAREILKPVIEILAGFPSVVIGFFALTVLASLLQSIFGFQYRLNAFVGGTALAFAVIPIIFTLVEDTLNALPKTLMEASYALGASKWETALFVSLPAATPGIFAAVLLGLGRAFGETMIVLMATGNAAILSPSFFEPVRTLSATIGAEMAEVVFGDLHYGVLFLIGTILFAFSFTLNAAAEFLIRRRLLRRFGGN